MNANTTLVADIGGTNTRLGLAGPDGIDPNSLRRFSNQDHADFASLTRVYLDQFEVGKCHQACLAIAAPIEGEAVDMTNRNWRIDKSSVSDATGAEHILLLNDFEALGFSLNRLTSQQVTHVAGPKIAPSANGTRLVLGAGTGFNAAAIISNVHGQRAVHAAECGHMTLPIETELELSLRDHLARGRGRASIERALSGQGVLDIYHWVCAQNGVHSAAYSASDIVSQAIDGKDSHCRAAVELLVKLLARVAGDLLLAYLPMGGIYLSGGVTRACLPLISSDLFWQEFTAKGRQAELIASIPVFLVTDDSAALEGCVSAMAESSLTTP